MQAKAPAGAESWLAGPTKPTSARKRAVAEAVAKQLFEAEQALDVALAAVASLAVGMPSARKAANLSAQDAQQSFDRASETLGQLAQARRNILAIHGYLAARAYQPSGSEVSTESRGRGGEVIRISGVQETATPSPTLTSVSPGDLLGGKRILGREVSSALDAHDLIVAGLPASALGHLVDSLSHLILPDSLDKAVGMSLRTWQRRKDEPDRLLSSDQSGRTWKFAEILAQATAVFGSQAEAEAWLERPAIGLNRRRPIDLLSTPAGVELVETYLTQMAYGVYV